VLIDCDTCRARPHACGDCVVTHLLASRPAPVDLDDGAWEAVSVLSAAGLVPPLRLVPAAGLGSGGDDDLSDGVSLQVTDGSSNRDDTPGTRRTERPRRDIA
jgi:hypothetical protein